MCKPKGEAERNAVDSLTPDASALCSTTHAQKSVERMMALENDG
jgi:hypothetical protein